MMRMAELRRNAPYIAMFIALAVALVGVVVIATLVALGTAS
jgi:hypothetical protein